MASDDLKKITELELLLAEKEKQVKTLQEKNHELDSIIAALPGNVYWKNKDGHYQGCNENIVGVAPIKHRQEFIGKTLDQLVSADVYHLIKEVDDRVLNNNEKVTVEEPGIDKQGNYALYLTQKTPLHDEHGNVTGLLGVSFNITERKKLEEELRQAKESLEIAYQEQKAHIEIQQRYEELLRILPACVYWKNKDGYYQGCNDGVVAVLGKDKISDVVGKTIYELMDFESARRIDEIDQEIMRTNIPKFLEERVDQEDGSFIIYLYKKIPLHDEKGNVIGLYGVSFDITERKKLEEELKQAKESLEIAYQELKAYIKMQQRYEELLKILPGNVYWKDRQGHYLGCSDNMVAAFGLKSTSDVIGKTIFDLVDLENAKQVDAVDEKIMQTNSPVFIEEQGYSAPGKPAIFISKKIPLHDEDGNVIGLLGISFDITERKKLESELSQTKNALQQSNDEQHSYIKQMQYLQDLISILPGNVYWKDRQGYYLGCNENMAKIAGIKSVHDIVGKTIYDVSNKDVAKQIDEIDQNIMKMNKIFSIEEEGLDALGRPAYYLTKKVPIRDQQGEVVGLVGISIDITERKQLEENLKLAKQYAEEANHMKVAFIKNMEHDIRTPFCGVYGLSKFLLDNEIDAEKKEILFDIVQSVEELLEYCNGILDFARAEFNHPLTVKEFNLKDLLQRLFAMQKPAAKAKGIAILFDLPDELPELIVGDEYRLHRILINLVSNAIKFTEKGYVKIQVTEDRCTERDILLKFRVKDTGIGIAPEKQALIYDLFTRLAPANQGIYKGLGVGLTIVKRFLEEMSGEIEVLSRPGEGTVFTFKICFQRPLTKIKK